MLSRKRFDCAYKITCTEARKSSQIKHKIYTYLTLSLPMDISGNRSYNKKSFLNVYLTKNIMFPQNFNLRLY